MICEYCGQEWREGQRCCWACGAPKPERTGGDSQWYQRMTAWQYEAVGLMSKETARRLLMEGPEEDIDIGPGGVVRLGPGETWEVM